MRTFPFAPSVLARTLAIAALVALAPASVLAGQDGAPAAPPIYVTTIDGAATNPSSFPSPSEVYLSATSCPVGGATLAPGQYFFEVTDQSGTVVLSTDPLASRVFDVGDAGAITSIPSHNSGTNTCPGGIGLSVKLQPFADLPAGQTQYTVHVAPATSVAACPVETPFCDANQVSATAFALTPNTVIPSASPSTSPSGSAAPSGFPSPSGSLSPGESGSAAPSPSPSGTTLPSSAPPSASSSPTRSPTPTATPRPTRTPPPTARPGTGGGGGGATGGGGTGGSTGGGGTGSGGGVIYYPNPTAPPLAPPKGFYHCTSTQILTPTGCKSLAQIAGQGANPSSSAGNGGTVDYGPTNPPQPGGTVIGVLPTFASTSGGSSGGSGGSSGSSGSGGSPQTPSGAPGPSASAEGSALPSGSPGVGPVGSQVPASAGTSPPPVGSPGFGDGLATPTLVAGGVLPSDQNAPPSAGGAAPVADTTAAASADPANAANATAPTDRNLAFLVIAALAAVALGVGSQASRLIRRRRRSATSR